MAGRFSYDRESGRWGHRPRVPAAVGVPTNRKLMSEIFIFRQRSFTKGCEKWLVDFRMIVKVAGGDTGHGFAPRLVSPPTAK